MVALTFVLLASLLRPVRAGWNDVPERWLPAHQIDANALVTLAGGAQVVALADATHGTHEFFAAKQELVPLFAAAGYRTLAFEAPYGEWERGEFVLDDYYFWNSDETMALIEWARAQDPPIRIAGLDPSHPAPAADLLVERVRAFDPSLAADIAERFSCVTAYRDNPLLYSARSPIDREKCRASVVSVRPLLHDEELMHNARLVEQGEEALWTQLANRDAAIAENIEWLAHRDGRVLVLGHNEHFGKTRYGLTNREQLDSAGLIVSQHVSYFAMGTMAFEGSFATYDIEGKLIELSLPAASSDDYATFFAAAGLPRMLIPLRGALPSWLATPHRMRVAGSSGPVLTLFEDLAKKFDALLYFETSTPVRFRR